MALQVSNAVAYDFAESLRSIFQNQEIYTSATLERHNFSQYGSNEQWNIRLKVCQRQIDLLSHKRTWDENLLRYFIHQVGGDIAEREQAFNPHDNGIMTVYNIRVNYYADLAREVGKHAKELEEKRFTEELERKLAAD